MSPAYIDSNCDIYENYTMTAPYVETQSDATKEKLFRCSFFVNYLPIFFRQRIFFRQITQHTVEQGTKHAHAYTPHSLLFGKSIR